MTEPLMAPQGLARNERGIALALAIFALVIIATLVAGVFFLARMEQRSGSNALWSTQAAEAADAGLNETLANWSGSYNGMAVGSSTVLATQTMGSTSRYTATVQRISSQIFMIQSRGERTGGGGVLAGTSVARIVRITIPDLNINAALTANGPVTQGGNSEIHGEDTVPPNWASCTPSPTVAGVRTSASYSTNGKASDITGDPPVVTNDTSVTSAKIVGPYTQLAAMANILRVGHWPNSDRPAPATQVIGGVTVCTTDDLNWGDPWRSDGGGGPAGLVPECTSRSPIIHVTGNVSLSGAGGGKRGQGILLVGGDLSISGNFEFTGIVIVMGSMTTTGTGSKITGAVLAENASIGDDVSITGNPHILYSSCAISTVLAQSAVARPVAERSWVQLY